MSHEHATWFAPDGPGRSVRGFLSPESSDFLSKLLTYQLDRGYDGSLVEIGTFMGRTFVGLAKAARHGEPVVGFDLFPPYVENGFKESLKLLSNDQLQFVSAFRKNTLEISTAEWIRRVKKPARFIHIDGGHSYDAIINDLHLASSFLAGRALIVLDDFMHDWYPDLTEGIINGLRASPGIVPIAIVPRVRSSREGGSKLICAARQSAAEYSAFLSEAYADRSPSLRPLVGTQVLTFQGF